MRVMSLAHHAPTLGGLMEAAICWVIESDWMKVQMLEQYGADVSL
jgi:hypothetical protein